jgi:HD-like signal output (HDOD) protein
VAVLRPLPDVPIFPEILLRLDLEVQTPCVDLRAISQLVLGDLGATLQILRLAGREYGNNQDHPIRIEDCISDLGLDACLEAVSAQTQAHDRLYETIAETWAHAREIAWYSQRVAEEMSEVNPEDAYLVGLLHGIGSLPTLLGWSASQTGAIDFELEGFRLAKQWWLPRCVVEFFSHKHMPGHSTVWQEIVRSAHHRANRSSVFCPFEQEMRPMLKK